MKPYRLIFAFTPKLSQKGALQVFTKSLVIYLLQGFSTILTRLEKRSNKPLSYDLRHLRGTHKIGN